MSVTDMNVTLERFPCAGFQMYVVSAFRRTSREVRLKPDTDQIKGPSLNRSRR